MKSIIAFFICCSALLQANAADEPLIPAPLNSCSGQVTASPQKREINGVVYHILRAAPSAIRILWKDDHGTQLRTFAAAADYLRKRNEIPSATTHFGSIIAVADELPGNKK
jgi:hypothetical protein